MDLIAHVFLIKQAVIYHHRRKVREDAIPEGRVLRATHLGLKLTGIFGLLLFTGFFVVCWQYLQLCISVFQVPYQERQYRGV